MDRESYATNDSLFLEAAIRNDDERPIFVYRNLVWGPGGFMIHVKDARGNFVQPEVLDDTFGPPPSDNDPTLFVKLEQYAFLGIFRKIPVKNLISRPGKYIIWIEYRSPIPRSYMAENIKKMPVLWEEDTPLLSDQTIITIR
jgi:hypothetical protein